VTVRKAIPKDASAIASLVEALRRSLNEPGATGEDYVATYLGAPANHILVAERSGRVLGMLSYSHRPSLYHAADCCTIEELVVAPEARGQGVGSRLLEEVLRQAEAAGCAEVSVSALADNSGALAFYRRHGLVDEALLLERHFPGRGV
jgi:ribosomal protein S18 acetylase RimI-like enzyme